MSIQLLDKTRKINKLLHNNNSCKFVFNDICRVLGEVLCSNVIVISRTGKILGIGKNSEVNEIKEYIGGSVGEYADFNINERLLGILSTKENVNLMTLGFENNNDRQYYAIITPIDISGERLGTLFIYRVKESYDIDDIILSEYGNTILGLEMIRSVSEENDILIRKKNIIDGAVKSLSVSETKAVICVLRELKNEEGILVASRLAQKEGITRSVIVNGIRKLESAGIIETHSNGMKGTYIKILNNKIYEWLDNMEVV